MNAHDTSKWACQRNVSVCRSFNSQYSVHCLHTSHASERWMLIYRWWYSLQLPFLLSLENTVAGDQFYMNKYKKNCYVSFHNIWTTNLNIMPETKLLLVDCELECLCHKHINTQLLNDMRFCLISSRISLQIWNQRQQLYTFDRRRYWAFVENQCDISQSQGNYSDMRRFTRNP